MTQLSHTKALLNGVANVLLEMALDVENIGANLCRDPAVLAEHFDQMQSVDVLAQTMRQIADVLQAPCALKGVSAVQLEGLRERLRECEAMTNEG